MRFNKEIFFAVSFLAITIIYFISLSLLKIILLSKGKDL